MNLSPIPEKYRSHGAFSPVSFRNISFPGRLVRSATEYFRSENGHVAAVEYERTAELSRWPFGAIIIGHTCVSPEGRSNHGQNALWDDEFIPEQARLAETIKKGGIKAVLQLGHGGMKAAGSNGDRPVYTPDTMTLSEIRNTVRAFGAAAVRAKSAGFDAIQLHAAHIYLLSEFFYPQYNHRTDAYGGSGERRFRIIREIAEEVKTLCGEKFPVFIKINSDNIENNDEYFKDLCGAAETCAEIGIEGMELSGYASSPPGTPSGPYFFDTAKKLLEKTSLPLMLVGGIRTLSEVEQILASGIVTVSFCRPMIEDTGFLGKLFKH
jgi:2,4-dienoyl-CoA reductase-like NADH-dependent reductase (Old Yellow Enzyme family)